VFKHCFFFLVFKQGENNPATMLYILIALQSVFIIMSCKVAFSFYLFRCLYFKLMMEGFIKEL